MSGEETVVAEVDLDQMEPDEAIEYLSNDARENAIKLGNNPDEMTAAEIFDLPDAGSGEETPSEKTGTVTETITQEAIQDVETGEETEKTESVQEEPEAGSGEPSEIENIRSEFAEFKKEHENLQKLYGQQSQELGGLRQYRQEMQPWEQKLSDPAFQQHALNFYPPVDTPAPKLPADFNPDNPNDIATVVDQRVEAKLRERQRQNAAQQAANNARQQQQNLANQLVTAQQQLVAGGMTPENAQIAVKETITSIFSGKLADLVKNQNRVSNLQAEIDAAYKRGGEDTLRKLNKNKQPKRTTSKTTNSTIVKSGELTDVTDMTEIELGTYLNSLDIDSPAYKKAMDHLEKMANQGL